MIGIINVLKPPAMTSHDVIYFIRRQLQEKQVGHTGTLDPAVSGVLPICVGKATKLSQYITDGTKVYRGQMVLGRTTDSQDAHGTVLSSQSAAHVTETALLNVCRQFQGALEQIPPMVSAVKIGGQKLYDLHKMGKEVERKPRQIYVDYFEILNIAKLGTDYPTIDFRIKCSKGTYIRTICHDVGQVLGVGAHLNHLIRTASGTLTIESAKTLEEIASSIEAGDYSFLLNPSSVLMDWELAEASEELLLPIGHGNMVSYEDVNILRSGSPETGTIVINAAKDIIAFARKRTIGDKLYLQPTTVI